MPDHTARPTRPRPAAADSWLRAATPAKSRKHHDVIVPMAASLESTISMATTPTTPRTTASSQNLAAAWLDMPDGASTRTSVARRTSQMLTVPFITANPTQPSATSAPMRISPPKTDAHLPALVEQACWHRTAAVSCTGRAALAVATSPCPTFADGIDGPTLLARPAVEVVTSPAGDSNGPPCSLRSSRFQPAAYRYNAVNAVLASRRTQHPNEGEDQVSLCPSRESADSFAFVCVVTKLASTGNLVNHTPGHPPPSESRPHRPFPHTEAAGHARSSCSALTTRLLRLPPVTTVSTARS